MNPMLFPSSTSQLESVADCVRRLGRPPDDIAKAWLDEANRLTRRTTIDAIDWNDSIWDSLRIAANGHLNLDPSWNFDPVEEVPSPDLPPPTIDDQPSSSRDTILPSRDSKIRSSRTGNWDRFALAAIAVMILFGIGWIFVSHSTPKEMVAKKTSVSGVDSRRDAARSGPDPFALRADAELTTADHESLPSPLDTVVPAVTGDIAPPVDLTGQNWSLDSLIPAGPMGVESRRTDTESSSGSVPMGQTDLPTDLQPSFATGSLAKPSVDELLADDADEDQADGIKDAVEQTTTRRAPIEPQVTDVALPPSPTRPETPTPEPVTILTTTRPPQSLTLEMLDNETEAIGFQLMREEGSDWQVRSKQLDQPIARIFARPDDPATIRFQWLPAVTEVSSTADLLNGRITTNDGDVVHLRPRLDADPVLLSLAKRDVKLKWNLQSPIPSGRTDLLINVVVPDEVDLQWIEPVDTTAARKTRAIAIFRLKTSDLTAIVARVDVRTAATLSMRLRFGARLDPAMPWQWTDAATIRSSFLAVTANLESADDQLVKLDVAIKRADRIRARRQAQLLEDQRDQIDDAVQGWTTIAKRLAELDQLVAFLDAGGSIEPELIVRWPDRDQIILGTTGR